MIIQSKHILSSFLTIVFMFGLVQETLIKSSADTTIVFEMEKHDYPDSSELDVDEELIDFSLPMRHMLLTKEFPSDNRFRIFTKLNLDTQKIGISQPTPPPKYIG